MALTQAYTHTARTRAQRRRRLDAWQTKSGGMPLGFLDAYFSGGTDVKLFAKQTKMRPGESSAQFRCMWESFWTYFGVRFWYFEITMGYCFDIWRSYVWAFFLNLTSFGGHCWSFWGYFKVDQVLPPRLSFFTSLNNHLSETVWKIKVDSVPRKI